ncbi:ubiquitin-like modifier hub1 [Orobanche gracilis]
MGSTGEADKKRRHFSSTSPTTATTKKQPIVPLSEEKKMYAATHYPTDGIETRCESNRVEYGRCIPNPARSVDIPSNHGLDAAVLQFQNQKLVQKLETQKVEISALQDKFWRLKDKQQSYGKILAVVNKSWEELVDDLESCSNCTLDFVKHGRGFECHLVKGDGESHPEDALLSRLLETGATESSSTSTVVNPPEGVRKIDSEITMKTKNILHNIVASIDGLNSLKHILFAASLKAVSSNGQSQRLVVSSNLQAEIKNLRIEVLKLHLKHRDLAGELQGHRDTNAKNKAVLKCLKGELETTIAELEESNCNLTVLKAGRGVAEGELFPVLNQVNWQVTSDKSRDNQRDVQDMESTLKELVDQSTSRLHELKRLHEDRLKTLKHLSDLQGNLKNINCICSSQAYRLLKDQLAKAKADVVQYQVEKESLYWLEKESQLKNEFVDVLNRSSAVANSRISDLEVEIQGYMKEKDLIEAKLEEASEEPGERYVEKPRIGSYDQRQAMWLRGVPWCAFYLRLSACLRRAGRNEIIAEFKALVSSFPEKMGNMQNQLAKHKGTAADIHCLRAHVESLATILDRKAKELEDLSSISAQQNAEIQKLRAAEEIGDLKETEADMKLFLKMFGHQSIDSREVSEARSSEIKAWVCVQGINSSLDERDLELRVKVANEAEAKAQQRLAASEAGISELRQKLEASKREKTRLSNTLKSKHEETEAYLSEIETIGQAYDDMQTQNQQLLQQITEIDDYNVKLVLEGVRARQLGDTLLMEKRMLEKTIQRTKQTVDFCNFKAARVEDQLKAYSDHLQRLNEDKLHNTASGENTQRRLSDVRRSSQQVICTLEEAQSKADKSREYLAQLQIELEKERFARKRVEEDIDTQRRKTEQLKSHTEGSSIAEKLQQELMEYKEILKCSVCLDRRKEMWLSQNATISSAILAYKKLSRHVTASAQFVLLVLGLMT